MEWRSLPEYKTRKRLLKQNGQEYLIHDAATRVCWLLTGCGQVSNDFEETIAPIFGL